MNRRDEECLFECIEGIKSEVHENNKMLRQIYGDINTYLANHNKNHLYRYLYLSKLLKIMLNTYYDSYGYNFNENFVTFVDRKKIKFPKPKNVAETLKEVDSFFEEKGPEVIDLVAPEVGQEF